VGTGESRGNRHLAQAERKVLRGDVVERRSRVPEVSDGLQGVLVRLLGQGLRPTIVRRRVMSATAHCGENITRLMRCPEAARLKGTVRKKSFDSWK
jgi:hypothetical protein